MFLSYIIVYAVFVVTCNPVIVSCLFVYIFNVGLPACVNKVLIIIIKVILYDYVQNYQFSYL